MTTRHIHISTVSDGNMDARFDDASLVETRRTTWWKNHGVERMPIACMRVVHGAGLVDVSEEEAHTSHEYACDALIVARAPVVLMLLTADCYPVVIHDAAHEVLALLHCGWRPVHEGLIEKTIAYMSERYGTHPDTVHVDIGPGIGRDSYKVTHPQQVNDNAWQPFLACVDVEQGIYTIDLYASIRARLCGGGVMEENIETYGVDTATSPNYFSHYRAVRTGAPEGRFATIAYLR